MTHARPGLARRQRATLVILHVRGAITDGSLDGLLSKPIGPCGVSAVR